MNKLQSEKIANIKKAIREKEDLKSIEKRFFNSPKKKQEYLDKVYNYFDPKDLDYLEYVNKTYGKISEFKPINEKKEEVKSIEPVEEKQDLDSKEKEIIVEVAEVVSTPSKSVITNGKQEITNSKSTVTNSNSEDSTTNDSKQVSNNLLTSYFKDIKNVEILIKLIEEYKSKSTETGVLLDEGEIEIPQEVLKLKNTGAINVKANAEQYQRIKELAVKNNVPIATFINFVLWDFLKKHS